MKKRLTMRNIMELIKMRKTYNEGYNETHKDEKRTYNEELL
jgi:hypothetical protein